MISLHCYRIIAHRSLKALAAVPTAPWDDDLDITSLFFLEELGRTTKNER